MLVLTRKIGESIVIDDEIVLKVTAIQGNRVKVSLEAPQSRRILRGEIAEGASKVQAPAAEAGWTRNSGETPRVDPSAARLAHAK